MMIVLFFIIGVCFGSKVYYLLNPNNFQSYLDADDFKFAVQYAPLFDSSDADLTEAFYFRLHSYRKHITPTPKGYIITEFLPPVPWGQYYNAIPAAMGHHLNEGNESIQFHQSINF